MKMKMRYESKASALFSSSGAKEEIARRVGGH